ncbi:MAG: arylsulfotransferase family protein [Candidatus Hydrogenedentes bacterium]|nr:arylsulfotransferase family protein [Candidatus Hydrogenedentota bacterium]
MDDRRCFVPHFSRSPAIDKKPTRLHNVIHHPRPGGAPVALMRALAFLVAGITCAVLVAPCQASEAAKSTSPTISPGDSSKGAWRKIPSRQSQSNENTVLSEADLEALEAIGYLGGYENVPDKIGVITCDEALAQNGYTLYISGHAPEAYLCDLKGKVIHTWAYDASKYYKISPKRNYWRRVHLAGNGDLYAVCDPHGIIKLDKNSTLLWASDEADLTHHDLFVTGEGTTYALGKSIGVQPEYSSTITLIDDYVVVIDQDGKPLNKFTMLSAFEKSPYEKQMLGKVKNFLARQKSDYAESFHTNTIEVFDGSLAPLSPLLKKGNVLCCSPIHGTVWIIDGETETVVWAWMGSWGQIHQPTFLKNGNWLLFDNAGFQNKSGDWCSQVLEYKFPDKEPLWDYAGDPALPETEFYSGTSSLADRLPNGNTLITVSESGRAIEVTQDKKVVWEFLNPKRAGENNELVATLFQVERIATEYCDTWLVP